MKVVLSRKGFDSSNGRVASPILPDRRLVSMPIPATRDPHTYNEVMINGIALGPLVEDLTAGKIERTRRCHLAPDLDAVLAPTSRMAADIRTNRHGLGSSCSAQDRHGGPISLLRLVSRCGRDRRPLAIYTRRTQPSCSLWMDGGWRGVRPSKQGASDGQVWLLLPIILTSMAAIASDASYRLRITLARNLSPVELRLELTDCAWLSDRVLLSNVAQAAIIRLLH